MPALIDNNTAIEFDEMTGGTGGRVLYNALLDSLTIGSGNLLYYSPLCANIAKYVAYNGDEFIYAPGHTFANSDVVRFIDSAPTGSGITLDARLAVINQVTDRFQVQAIGGDGSTPIDITAGAAGRVGKDKSILVEEGSIPQINATVMKMRMRGTNYLTQAVMNAVFKDSGSFGGLDTPPTMAVALLTGTPADTDTGATISEIAYTGYARKAAGAAVWNTAAAY